MDRSVTERHVLFSEDSDGDWQIVAETIMYGDDNE